MSNDIRNIFKLRIADLLLPLSGFATFYISFDKWAFGPGLSRKLNKFSK